MERKDSTVMTYAMGKDWLMDVVYNPNTDHAEAWIYREMLCMKIYMFGCDLHQNDQSLQDFIDDAQFNFDSYKEDFRRMTDIVETIECLANRI